MGPIYIYLAAFYTLLSLAANKGTGQVDGTTLRFQKLYVIILIVVSIVISMRKF